MTSFDGAPVEAIGCAAFSGEDAMLLGLLHRIRSSRLNVFVAASVLVLIVGFALWQWQDFCLWRADACLVLRDDRSAAMWIDRSDWGRRPNVRSCLIQLRLARRQKRFRDVERDLQLAAQLGAPAAEILRQQWLACAQTQQFEQMQSHWTDLLADPRDDEPEIARAFIFWASARHQLDDALRVISVWHQDFPLDPEPLAFQGRIYLASNFHEGAEEAYREALSLDSTNDEYRLGLAEALSKRLKLDQAIPLYRACLGRHPDHVTAISGLAQAYTSQGEIKQAVELLQSAVSRHPDDLDLRQTLGEVLLASGDAKAAAPELQLAYQAHPENADLAYSLGRALKGSGNESAAQPLFAFAAESRESVNQLKELEEQLRKRPKDLELRMKLAAITAKYKSRQDAIRWYENLLAVAPGHLAAHAALAELYRQGGDEQRASAHAARVRDHTPAASSEK